MLKYVVHILFTLIDNCHKITKFGMATNFIYMWWTNKNNVQSIFYIHIRFYTLDSHPCSISLSLSSECYSASGIQDR